MLTYSERLNLKRVLNATGVNTGGRDNINVANPLKWEVAEDVIWSVGWWQSSDGSWWLLVKATDVDSFTRADADFYIPAGDIADVPQS